MGSLSALIAAGPRGEAPSQWGRRLLILAALLAYTWLIFWAQAPLLDSCEPCEPATLRWLGRDYALHMYYLAFGAALLLPLIAIAGALATAASRRFATRVALPLLIALLVLGLLDLRLLAYW
jgi:hypothetical protein